VRRLPGGYRIEDRLEGTRRPLRVAQSFLCAPELTVRQEGDALVLRAEGEALCRLMPPAGFSVVLRTDPTQIVTSPCFGELLPTVQIVFEGRIDRSAAAATIEIARPPVRMPLVRHGAEFAES
jgi:hypothetical protein